jgi:ankyrin repeat protein
VAPDLDAQDHGGSTALSLAIVYNLGAIIERLLAHRAPPNLALRDGDGCTPLMLAARNRLTELVERLAQHAPPPFAFPGQPLPLPGAVVASAVHAASGMPLHGGGGGSLKRSAGDANGIHADAAADGGGNDLLPCEFCDASFAFVHLSEHQRQCPRRPRA